MTEPAPLPPGFLRDLRSEVEAGLPNERDRLDEAARNLAFYQGEFKNYAPKLSGGNGYAEAKPRWSLVMQRVVNVLTGTLYKDGPKRTLAGHDRAGAWLEACYRANAVDALFRRADAMAMVSDVAMFQALGTADPDRPVRVLLWDASQFAVWRDPDDQTRPVAVAVLDKYDEQRRARVWTASAVDTYLTAKVGARQTAGGVVYRFAGSRPNPFGFLPFSFVNYDLPLTDFWTPGPGDFLQSVNEQMILALTENWASITYNLRPLIVGKNVRIGSRPGSPIRPGDIWYPAAELDASGEAPAEVDVSYLQADSSFSAASWDDFQSYLDHTLEMCGVPPATIRMTQDSARSGVSIVAEQAPLVDWAKSRQRPFSYYEDELARLALRVGAGHLGSQEHKGYRATAAELEAAAEDPGLQLRWPKMYPQVPGVELDTADQWLLDNRMASRTVLLMRRESFTREEAESYLQEVADDLKREQEIFADVTEAEAETSLKATGKHPDQLKAAAQAETDDTKDATDDEQDD